MMAAMVTVCNGRGGRFATIVRRIVFVVVATVVVILFHLLLAKESRRDFARVLALLLRLYWILRGRPLLLLNGKGKGENIISRTNIQLRYGLLANPLR